MYLYYELGDHFQVRPSDSHRRTNTGIMDIWIVTCRDKHMDP
ncbi:Hypothetical protein LEPBI_II0165 [Leptospira biflexa serovar Patoc strain 'Patoc 1 (Paris)']|uniref:Uncharacterized protein n=1 Tax=Leptospira biflexa serovar Patoc (strain Patoc 1 / ATCC 23582 / Paris) TaxID=456481 RepID=B0SU16_LEPBP|nr:Hypothetical protein LEPBI_II0165 [Leptospira biflexa serovar Patoc strain 'Patoc 1 (Paris)']